ncbi:hypothetical protein KKF29_01775, partial [Patescibacteria group bacterium]|nr:hypothetical protein [Patescibacteria group bacterium]
MKEIRNLKNFKWTVFGISLVTTIVYALILTWELNAPPLLAVLNLFLVIVTVYMVLHFTFNAIIKREDKLKEAMKELFSSYQYIGNVNRQIDTLTNLNKYITKADFTDKEIIAFIVNTCGRLAEADLCTVFLKNGGDDYKKTKVYYYQNRGIFESIISHLKCESCKNYISDNEFIMEVNKESEKKCGSFPDSFWNTYTLLSFPIVFKGKKKGFMIVIHNNKVKISH